MNQEEGQPKTTAKHNQEINAALREVKTLKENKITLLEEKQQLLQKIQSLQLEIDGIDASIASAEIHINSKTNRITEHKTIVDNLRLKNNQIVEEINELKKKIKRVNEDIQNSKLLNTFIEHEKQTLETEKEILEKNLRYIEDGISEMANSKELCVPYLMRYDNILKNLYSAFKEVEIRMDVAVKLSNPHNH
ncbi:magnetosome protein Mad26 [Candidatus Magnetoovum chiemensis]|nr:magnetosome protein Mad26 [Candidatus Magnetoovum chiemensis]